ncbi:MAG: hypothetical protein WC503_00720 [Candidatus Shapirobacteria bacterium]
MTTVIEENWSYFYGIVKIEDLDGVVQKIEIPFKPYGVSEEDYYNNNFFYLERMSSMETSATSALDIPAETDFYLLRRKGGVVQEYVDNLVENGSSFTNTIDMTYFINPYKIHQYIGKIYPQKEVNQYRIDYWGYDRYALTCIPEHNQTTKLKEFFKITFDQVYNAFYSRAKTIKTLIDAKEIPLDYLPYLAEIYNYQINKSYFESLFIDKVSEETRARERRLKELVANIINYLKRKGTYSSLYITFKTLFWATENNLNVYERWHPDSVFDLSHDYDLEPYFIDFNYLSYYDALSVGCTGAEYYTLASGKGFNVPLDNCYIHKQNYASDRWYIAHSLDDRIPVIQCFDSYMNLVSPSEVACIDSSSLLLTFHELVTGFALITKPQYMNPLLSISELHSHNLNQIAPLVEGYYPTTFTYNTTTLPISGICTFETVMPSGMNDILVANISSNNGTQVVALSGDYFHIQAIDKMEWEIEHNLDSKALMADFYLSMATSAWTITHTLNSKNLVYQIYSEGEATTNCSSLYNITNDVVKVNFASEENGRIFLLEADETLTLPLSSGWMSTYTVSGGDVQLLQAYDTDYNAVNDLDIRPIYTNTLALSSTYPFAGYLEVAIPDYVEAFLYRSNIWNINHNLNSLNIITNIYSGIDNTVFQLMNEYSSSNLFIQVYDLNRRLLNTISASASTDTISVSLSAAEQIFINTYQIDHDQSVFTYTQTIPSACWWVEHYLDNYEIVVRVYSGGIEIIPDELHLYNKNWTNILFNTPTSGDVIIYVAEQSFIPTVKDNTPEVEIVDENNIVVTFPTSAIGYVACGIADSVCTTLFQGSPENFQAVDKDNVTASFASSASGMAILREVGQLTYADGLLMSPHYKAEIDLNCEPLCDRDILNRDYALMLYDQLEVSRPASKYSHYSLLLSPITDFSEETIKTYDDIYGNVADFYTYCCVDTESTSAGFIYRKYVPTSKWSIFHGLNTENVLVQCYDNTYEMVFPLSVKIIDTNNVSIEFDSPFSGLCLIGAAKETLTNTYEASASWGFTHSQETSAVLSDYYFYLDKEQMLPSNVSITEVDQMTSTWYVPTLGYCQIRNSDYLYVQSVASTEWIITHTLDHKGVLVQLYDDELKQIFPKTITLFRDKKQITITLEEQKSGYAFVTCLGGLYTKEYVIESLSNGYIEIGNGASTENYDAIGNNALKNTLISSYIYDLIITEDSNKYYIKGFFNGNKEETTITEMGLFNEDDELMFYTYIKSELYKVSNFDITSFYRINKNL